MRPKYTRVRARSANEGSGTAGRSLVAPVPACFLMDEEDIDAPPGSLNNRVGVVHHTGRNLLSVSAEGVHVTCAAMRSSHAQTSRQVRAMSVVESQQKVVLSTGKNRKR
jgi:hypothetical protein